MKTKIIALSLSFAFLLSFFSNSYAEFQSVSCTGNPAFTDNDCTQCFHGGDLESGDNVGGLAINWAIGKSDQILFKDEQTMPIIINLGGNESSWVQSPSSDGFWEWAPEFEALYNEEKKGYILGSGEQTPWLKTKLNHTYVLEKNDVMPNENVGLIKYAIKAHGINSGSISEETTADSECILYASANKIIQAPAALPDSGPEHIILILAAALLLGFFLFRRTRKS